MEAIFSKATKHLSKDPIFKSIISPCKTIVEARFNGISATGDLYLSLLRSIVSQQLSTKAANTIYLRFINLYPNHNPIAAQIIQFTDDELRAVGLSYQKVSYIKAVANYSLSNSLNAEHINKLNNEEIIAELTSIKGVGKWTVEMLLIFGLKRLNVFPYDDLIIKNRIIALYGLQTTGKQLKADCFSIAYNWEPYQSIACLFLWESNKL